MQNSVLQFTPATVLCCNCGTAMDGTKGLTMCFDCIKLTTDITQGIPREAHVNFCRNCERYMQPPSQWIVCQPESRELLALLLRRIKGLNKVRLVDARFLWTEPHSRRIQVEIAVQAEAQPGVILQQNAGLEFVVIATQCPDCAKSFTVHTWQSCIQIRQKVPHKRTFFHLEQLILKHNAHADTVSIKESRDGIDFFYSKKNHAIRMLEFLDAVVPMKFTKSEELISQDTHSGTKSYKFTFSVEIIPICRDDLVCLPKSVANQLGNISQTVLCRRITNSVHFIDPNTLQTAEISVGIYWRQPFASLANASQLVKFFVIDVEPLGPSQGKYALADCTICRENDLNTQYFVRTHLGGILHAGDVALGYFSKYANYNDANWDELPQHEQPDIVLVKKYYPKRTKADKRKWGIRRMANEHNFEREDISAKDQDRADRDLEAFMQEIEEDKEIQGLYSLYKKPVIEKMEVEDSERQEGGNDEIPSIDPDELLDGLNDLSIS